MSLATFNLTAVGRLGNDCTVREVKEQFAISFSIAVSEKRGENYATTWLNFTLWSKTNKLAEYLKKGKLVSVVSDWFDITEKDGKQYTNFRVKDINPFLERNEPVASQPTEKPKEDNPFADEGDDSLPF